MGYNVVSAISQEISFIFAKKETRHLDGASGPIKFVKFVSFVIYFRNFTSHKTTFLANYIQHSAFHT